MLFIDEGKIGARRAVCIAHPLKRRVMLVENEALEYTARAFGILTYYKLSDDIMDEKLLRRIAISLLRPIFKRAKRRAGLRDLADVICDRLGRINELQKQACPSVDTPAGLFGELLGEIFAFGLSGSDRVVTYAVGYHLGKFIYAADAAEDYERDRASGSYNPYVLLYGREPLTAENKRTIKCALILECREIENAVNLLPFGNLATIENILLNIVCAGLVERIKFLDGTDTDKKKRREEESLI
jgi:hypothetical protein